MGNFRCEPSLTQMLADPMMQVLMESDGVDPQDLRDLLSAARRRIADAHAGDGLAGRSRC
jgi:hypothetical protein